MNVNATQSGLVDKWIDGSMASKKSSHPGIQSSNHPVDAPAQKLPIATETTAFTVPIQNADAASAAIQSVSKIFSAQPQVATLAQATEFSENALRLLQ